MQGDWSRVNTQGPIVTLRVDRAEPEGVRKRMRRIYIYATLQYPHSTKKAVDNNTDTTNKNGKVVTGWYPQQQQR